MAVDEQVAIASGSTERGDDGRAHVVHAGACGNARPLDLVAEPAQLDRQVVGDRAGDRGILAVDRDDDPAVPVVLQHLLGKRVQGVGALRSPAGHGYVLSGVRGSVLSMVMDAASRGDVLRYNSYAPE